jgi:hypothetical protein
MKSKAMNRPMFMDAENVGIMQGFKDEDMQEGYETEQMIDRTPSSPEILMNNLRGDMRSIDARMEELSQLVGEEAAMETPDEVLALLQPVLASQQGIAGLPAGMPDQPMGSPTPPSPMGDTMPAPDMGMMPPDMGMPQGAPPMPQGAGAMPPGPPPTAQAPLNMAEGGYVQSFQAGSDEEGVTPSTEPSPPVDPYSAEALLQQLDARRDPEALRRSYEELMPVYQDVLGGTDRSATQSQILFDIAQAGLNLAAGTDARGQPVRPGASFASSLAGAAQGLPERIGARVGQMEQQEQGVRLAALKGAQDEASGQRSLEEGVLTSYALEDRRTRDAQRQAAASAASSAQAADTAFQQQLFLQTLKAQQAQDLERAKQGLEALKLPTNWQYATAIELAVPFGEGKTTPEQDEKLLAAAALLMRPTTVRYSDDKGKPVVETKEGIRLPSLTKALKKRGVYDAVINGEFDVKDSSPEADVVAATSQVTTDASAAPSMIPQTIQDEIRAAGGDASKLSKPAADFLKQNVSPVFESGIDPTVSSGTTLWASHKNAIGIFRQIGRVFGDYVPFDFAGTFSAGVKQNTENIQKLKTNFAQAFRETKKLANAEREEINQFLNLEPRFFQNEVSYRNNLISLTTTLDALSRKANAVANDPNATLELKNLNEDKMAELKGLQQLLGAPMVIRTQADLAKLAQLPIGTEVLLFDSKNQKFVLDTVKPRQ